MRLPVLRRRRRRGLGIGADVVLDRRSSTAVLDRRERAAHQHDPQRERARVGEVGDVRPRTDAEQHVDVRELLRRAADPRPRRRRGAGCGRTPPGASTSPSTVLTPARSTSSARAAHHSAIGVVGVVAGVGVDPEPHSGLAAASLRARATSTGYWNGNAIASSRVGQDALAREQQRIDELSSEAQLQRRTSAWADTVGRCRTWPSAAAKSAFVTGFGDGEVDRAAQARRRRSRPGSRRSRRRARSSSSTACPNPACRRDRAGTAAACASSAPPSSREHDAGADVDRADTRVGRGPGLGFPGLADVGEEVVARRAVLGRATRRRGLP